MVSNIIPGIPIITTFRNVRSNAKLFRVIKLNSVRKAERVELYCQYRPIFIFYFSRLFSYLQTTKHTLRIMPEMMERELRVRTL